jgi:hypothetical protein
LAVDVEAENIQADITTLALRMDTMRERLPVYQQVDVGLSSIICC